MKYPSLLLARRQETQAAALIIVLGFVVLLSVLALAFLSSATLNRQVSQASASMSKSKIFAQGAIDTIVGDLRQEVVDGEVVNNGVPDTNYTMPATDAAGPVTNLATGLPVTLYRPQTGLENTVMPSVAVVPQLASPSPMTAADVPINLVKRSYYQVPSYLKANGYAVDGADRASLISTTQPSQNGRYFTPARWNKPLLMPRNPNGTANDLTPVYNGTTTLWANGDCPDWILVGRDGTNPLSVGASKSNFSSRPTDPNYVVGRYAYMIYDEGSLLDANVAGYPSSLPNTTVIPTSSLPGNIALTGINTTSTSNISAAVGAKTAESFADLTQIGMTQQEVDDLVGWRNYATTQPGGVFPAYSFANASSAQNYFSAVFNNNNGFTTLNSTLVPANAGNQTDRAFPTRQSLIQFLTQAVPASDAEKINLQNVLPYLTSYSRDLNQPSTWPDPNRPLISTSTGSTSSSSWDVTAASPSSNWYNYLGQNDAIGEDKIINPPFLSVRVTVPFNNFPYPGSNPATRFDGTIPNIGDPLVNKRFPLCRLAWLTYKGPSAANFATADATYRAITLQGVTQETINEGTDANIYACFGLTWGAPVNTGVSMGVNKCWIYNHGAKPPGIMKLSDVAKAGREPDFFELLKAAITTGSLGKGAATSEDQYGSASNLANAAFSLEGIYQHTSDTTTDYQIIQIGADIIDQFDADGYPTWIQFSNSKAVPAVMHNFFGIENLPYLQSIITAHYQLKPPIPLPQPTNYAQVRELIPPKNGSTGNAPPAAPVQQSVPLSDTGAAVALSHPVLWNPYDMSSSPGYPSVSNIRFTADSHIPTDPSTAGAIPYVLPGFYASISDGPPSTTDYSANSTFTFNSGSYKTYSSKGAQYIGIQTSNPPPFAPSNSEMDFTYTSNSMEFREPTVLMVPNQGGIGLKLGISNFTHNSISVDSGSFGGPSGFKDVVEKKGAPGYIGIYLGTFPLRIAPYPAPLISSTDKNHYILTAAGYASEAVSPSGSPNAIAPIDATCRLDWSTDGTTWTTYDEKFVGNVAGSTGFYIPPTTTGTAGGIVAYPDVWQYGAKTIATFYDARTPRFGSSNVDDQLFQGVSSAYTYTDPYFNTPVAQQCVIGTFRTSNGLSVLGGGGHFNVSNAGNALYPKNGNSQADLTQIKWSKSAASTSPANNVQIYPGWYSQNNSAIEDTTGSPQYYADPDSVVRRATAAYVGSSNYFGSYASNYGNKGPMGLPLATAYGTSGPGGIYGSATANATGQTQSRPIMLNRPFRSVADLGYVFRGEPFKNIDLCTPESGDSALLDVFCVNEDNRNDALVAGKVNINTRQAPVLEALLSGACRDETQAYQTYALSANNNKEVSKIANLIIARSGKSVANAGQFANIGELVGKWVPGFTSPSCPQPLLGGAFDGIANDIFQGGSYAGVLEGGTNAVVERYMESAIRALADVGTARTWNLLIDVVAQTGRYPAGVGNPTANGTDHFVVEGEQRYWVHVAIDRYTGQVIDENVELVKE